MKLLTLDDLDWLREKKNNYFKKKQPNSSQPIPLFENSIFNSSNWNCGEATPIRNFIYDLEYKDAKSWQYEFEVDYPEFNTYIDGDLFINLHYANDYTYVQLLVDGAINKELNDGLDVKSDYFTNQYFIKIYKRRGGIESFVLNGNPIKRNEYLSLLHILQSVGMLEEE